jgi:hypothetical protein
VEGDSVPNELAFSVTQLDIQPPELVFLGRVLARPYERIRVLAFCPPDAVGDVELRLSHLEGEGAPGLLDRLVLTPGTSINQVYEIPGQIVGVSAAAIGDTPTSAAVWIWGFRLGEGAPPSTGPGQGQPSTGTLEIRAVLDDGAGGPGESAGAGVIIRLDGREVGVSDGTGIVTVSQPAGDYILQAELPAVAVGEAEVTVTAGQLTSVTVILTPLPSTGTLIVRVVLDDGAGGPGESAGAGVIIRLDGREVGVSDGTGIATVSQPAGDYILQAVLPSLAVGEGEVTISALQTTEVTVVLSSDRDLTEPAELVMDELTNGGLSWTTTTVTLRFVRDGVTVPVTTVYSVEVTTRDPAFEPLDLTSLFLVTSAGTVQGTDAAQVMTNLAAVRSPAFIRVSASDARGFSYDASLAFIPGVYRMEVELAAPPSQPALAVDGLTVQAEFSTGVQASFTTDANGRFNIPAVPAGLLYVAAGTESGGLAYTVEAYVAVFVNTRLLLRLRGTADVVAGVLPWETSFLPTLVPAVLDGAERAEAASLLREPSDSRAAAAPVSVTVTGLGQLPVIRNAQLVVPQNTRRVILVYQVWTEEYPKYVLTQSLYDDHWGVRVLNDRGPLFSIARHVNSQLFTPPVWDDSGSSGEVHEEIDVSGLTTNGDLTLTLEAEATNVRDGLLDTTVTASLVDQEDLTINGIAKDQVVPTNGVSDHVSIPTSGDTNVRQRVFTVTFTMADDMDELTNVHVDLIDAGGATLQTVVDEAPGTVRVQQPSRTTLEVQVTFSEDPCTIDSTPPPTDRIRYRFRLRGRREDGTEVQSRHKDSEPFFPLWRMPTAFLPDARRYSERDAGFDDWCSRRTYTWMENHDALITRINDISLEHAHNTVHKSHALGTEIDLFHVFTFPGGAASGEANYFRMKEDAQAALGGDQAALGRLNQWAVQTRARFDQLFADNQVRIVIYGKGLAHQDPGQPPLDEGWAERLLKNGTYTNSTGKSINLATGPWANAGNGKLKLDLAHYHHIHLGLR